MFFGFGKNNLKVTFSGLSCFSFGPFSYDLWFLVLVKIQASYINNMTKRIKPKPHKSQFAKFHSIHVFVSMAEVAGPVFL